MQHQRPAVMLSIYSRSPFPPVANALIGSEFHGNRLPKFETPLFPKLPINRSAIALLQRWIEEDEGKLSDTFDQEEAELLRNRMTLRQA